jgi:hypothetical protein
MRVKHALRIYITDSYLIFNASYFVMTFDRVDKSPSQGHNILELMVARESIKKKDSSTPLLIFSLFIKLSCGLQFYRHTKMFLRKFSLLSFIAITKVGCCFVVRSCIHKRNVCFTLLTI